MSIKKITTLLLSVMLVLTMFAGCGNGSKGTTAQKPATEPSAVETSDVEDFVAEDPAEEPTAEESAAESPTAEPAPEEDSYFPLAETAELSVWCTLTNGLGVDSNSELAVSIEKERITNVHIEYCENADSAFMENTQLMIASGDYPDIADGIRDFYTGGLSAAVFDGVVVDLADYLNDYMPNYKAVLESEPKYSTAAHVNGDSIAAAYGFNTLDSYVTYGPVIRQDWLDDLGLEAPVTYDEYYEVLTAFKNQKGADAALWIGSFNGAMLGNYLSAGYGIATFMFLNNATTSMFYNVDGTIHYSPLEDAYREYMSMLNKWYEDGIVYQDYYSSPQFDMPTDDLVVDGHTGIFYTSASNLNYYSESTDGEVQISGIHDAVQSEGDALHFYRPNDMTTCVRCVMDGCENIELACRWLDWNYTEEGRMLYNYGIEGESYNLVNGEVQYTDLILNNPDLNCEYALWRYAAGSDAYVTDFNRLYCTLDDKMKAATELWGESDGAYNIGSEFSMSSEISSEFSVLYADIITYISEKQNQFINGDADIDDDAVWNEFQSRLRNELNAEHALELYQQAFDEYYGV